MLLNRMARQIYSSKCMEPLQQVDIGKELGINVATASSAASANVSLINLSQSSQHQQKCVNRFYSLFFLALMS